MKFISLSLIIILCSCATIDESNTAGLQKFTRNKTTLVEGVYLNQIPRTKTSLWNLLLYNNENNENKFIRIEFPDETTLKLVSYDLNNKREALRKGKFKDGYFILKRKVKLSNHAIVFNGLADQSLYLGLHKSDNLAVLSSAGGVLLFVAIPIFSAGNNTYIREFKRVEMNQKMESNLKTITCLQTAHPSLSK